jgi:hypothetical protein
MPKRRTWGEETLVQISYRVPISLRDKINKLAKRLDVSTTQLVVAIMERGLKRDPDEILDDVNVNLTGLVKETAGHAES